MEDLTGARPKTHKCVLMDRNLCNLNGILDVLSFDLNEVLLETERGMLMVKGSELHVKRLSLEKGEVDLEGRIDSLTYSENTGYGNKGESFLTRLFK